MMWFQVHVPLDYSRERVCWCQSALCCVNVSDNTAPLEVHIIALTIEAIQMDEYYMSEAVVLLWIAVEIPYKWLCHCKLHICIYISIYIYIYIYMGQVTEVWLSCYLVLLSTGSIGNSNLKFLHDKPWIPLQIKSVSKEVSLFVCLHSCTVNGGTLDTFWVRMFTASHM